MPYRFATEDMDYSDFSGGRVLYSLPGLPAFPVRLASEIFQRSASHLKRGDGGLSIYDPTCGGAYHLTALGFLHGGQIRSIFASDVDPNALELASRNLGLLSEAGLTRREEEIRRMLRDYGKPSHMETLRSVEVLRQLRGGKPAIATRVFPADALAASELSAGLQGETIDLVISDVPYGLMSGWQGDQDSGEVGSPLYRMLDALAGLLTSRALVAIAADKRQKAAHPGYQRVEHFQVGKRQVVLLRPKNSGAS